MSDAENNNEQPTTLDETEKLAAIKLAEENRMDPNIIKAMREAPASSALIDAAARAKTPAEMMEQFANLDPSAIPPEMRTAVQQFKEQQEQKKLEDEALLKKAALAAEVGFATFAAAVTTANRTEAASTHERSNVQDIGKMSATEKVIYFERLANMTAQQWSEQTDDQKRQDVSNVKQNALEVLKQSLAETSSINERLEASLQEKYKDLPPKEREEKVQEEMDEWYKKTQNALSEKDFPPDATPEEKALILAKHMTAESKRLREEAEKESDPVKRQLMLEQAQSYEKFGRSLGAQTDMSQLEQKTELTASDGAIVIDRAREQVQAAKNETELKESYKESRTALKQASGQADKIEKEENQASINAARLNNIQAQADALKADSSDAFDMSDLQAGAPQAESTASAPEAEAPRLSQDLTQLQRAQQMMAEYDANSQKPANDAEGPKAATAKAPTVSNS